ncbi:LacI family transcriptional regulator [Paenibacillus elgii]|uniref:LacI family transcriptional regulator n=1 Tax=Paenibacillus elgii TaxID=189691 RepID=A0A165PZQ2_9BACL|nr:LacI family DNA-binding transcriptional regulator [Paenibacillus elgii]KZE73124.1 LacI family transcriptional regulator [Paenibacillus elgii]
MKVNIFDVAKKSGLSVVTVSRVLNNSPSVREKNRQKILQAIKELNYIPNSAARTLVRGKTGVIGLTITALGDTVFDCIVKRVNDRLKQSGYFLAISISNETDHELEEASSFLFQEDRVDGIIVLSPVREEQYIAELEIKGIPYVVIDNQNEHANISTINVDNYKGGYEATKHLLSLGHTRIAHVSGEVLFLSARERQKGFIDALADEGLSPFLIANSRFGIRSGYQVMRDWIQSGQVPTAVFAGDDAIALGVVEALEAGGYRVPEDVSVIGYDDQELASEVHPRLTTIRQPAGQMGEYAVKVLLDKINGLSTEPTKFRLVPELIVRESTGICKDQRQNT